jgi:IS30 family transposase
MRSAPPSEPSCDKTPATTLRIITRSASSALCEAPHKAEFERDLIRARTGEGRERAKARGVKMGRKPKLTPHQQAEAIKRREAGEPIREIARSYNVHNSTISRLAV